MTNASRLLLARITALLLVTVSGVGVCYADTNVSGYLKSFAVAQDEIDTDFLTVPNLYQSQNSGRVMLEGFSSRLVWQVHYEVSPVFVSRGFAFDLTTFNVVSGSYRLTDIDTTLTDNPEDKNQVYQNLDRLNLQIQLDQGDLTIGRQAISFGSARVINPTDIFLPFDVRTFNTEYRTGVDAVRFQRPWGDLGEIDVGIVLGEDADADNSAAFLQLRGNYDGKDLHFAYIEYARQTLTGFGVQSALGDYGFWFEAAYVDGDRNYYRVSTGLDYAFTENTFGQIEYHYNGAGSDDPGDYIANLGTLPYQKGGVFLLGEDYLIPAFSYQLSPLWVVSAQAIINVSDDSAFTSIAAEYNVAENFYMDFGYYKFIGDDFSVTPTGQPLLDSEYGGNPDTLYASIRFYF